MEELALDDLMVLQKGLRNASQLQSMIDYVNGGGFWTAEKLRDYSLQHRLIRIGPLMEIAEFPDGKKMVHDGHHRAVATLLGGRTWLLPEEYTLKKWQYADYEEINFENRWVTPFDPRTEIRIADIFSFKTTVLRQAESDPEGAKQFVAQNRHLYCSPRDLRTVADLAAMMSPVALTGKAE